MYWQHLFFAQFLDPERTGGSWGQGEGRFHTRHHHEFQRHAVLSDPVAGVEGRPARILDPTSGSF